MTNATYHGLTSKMAGESRRLYGSNVLTPPAKEPLWRQFVEKFRDPLIIVLLVAGTLSIGISLYEYLVLGHGAAVFFEPSGIFIAILLATGLSFYFELKADREFSILNQINDEELYSVLRDGCVMQIKKCDIVVGDVVLLNTGDEVPADGELLDAVTLLLDESSLTGEPSCAKTTDEAHYDPDATYPSNHVMRGTNVMEGHGVMHVTRVGDNTEMGKVFTEAQIDDSVKTPLNEQMERLGKVITRASYAVAAMIVVGRMVSLFCYTSVFDFPTVFGYILSTLMIAVTLIVVSVPEGLPMAVTLSLAFSMRRMLKTNNLVRKMHACETMGAATVICTDKTGTLTQNRMSVREMLAEDDAHDLLCENIAVNSTATLDGDGRPVGNPTEGALLLWLTEQGIDFGMQRQSVKRLSETPFSTERKYMSTEVMSAVTGTKVLYVKGAPEIVAAMCGVPLPETVLSWQKQAMRTLAFACKKEDDGQLVWLGCCAISDPVRADVPEAVRECLNAGIQIKVVTGDTPVTAREIARQIGLEADDDGIITGPEFAALTDEQLHERVESLKIIARARPSDKKRLVEMLQRHGHVVAVTGDGTNDAPALNAAHVGLSMGDGTSVAKEASDITIIDNSFASIGRAVMWGRSLYRNIQRFLLFQLTVNVSACLLVMVGSFMGVQSPLTVTQMLWVNLIMDTFGAMALASLPPVESVMLEKPRERRKSILERDMACEIVGVGVLFFIITLALLYVFEHADVTCMTDLLNGAFAMSPVGTGSLTPYELTLLFNVFVWMHFWYMFNARAFKTGRSALHLGGCSGFVTIVFVIAVGQVVIVEVLPEFFNIVPMRMADWIVIVCSTSLVLWIREAWCLVVAKKSPVEGY